MAVLHAVTAGALDRATDVAATLEVRGFGFARRPPRMPRPWSRHDFAFAASAVAGPAIAIGVLAGLGRASRPIRASRRRSRRPDLAALAALAVTRCSRSPTAGDRGMRCARARQLVTYTYRYPARRAGPGGVSLAIEPGELVLLAGGSGSGQVDAAARRLRARPALPRRDLCGRAPGRRARHARARAGRRVGGGGNAFQDPETQVVMGTVRAELAFPLENRGWAAPAVARGVEEAALALGSPGCWTGDPRALRR